MFSNHQTQPTALDLINDFEKLCYHQEEPFHLQAFLRNTKCLNWPEKHGVKVLLDGQGADEILAGYPKYIHWYLQEVLSRNKLGATQIERKAFRRNNQPFKWDIKNIVAAYSAFACCHAARKK